MPPTEPFVISRVFNAPRELVYQVNTQPAHMAHWLTPQGFKAIHTAMDFRVGGTYHYGLEGPGGMLMWGRQVYREIVPNEKLVLIQSFSDKDGGITPHPLSPTWPLEMLATTTFEDAGPGKTKVTISWLPYNANEAGNATFEQGRGSMTQGFAGTFTQLDAYLLTLVK
jgi:uncharacterized protein YndB with AHSA1/START domain